MTSSAVASGFARWQEPELLYRVTHNGRMSAQHVSEDLKPAVSDKRHRGHGARPAELGDCFFDQLFHRQLE